MKIAVDTRYSEHDHREECAYFLPGVLKILIKKYPQHEFILIVDRPYPAKFLIDNNVTAVVAGPKTNNFLLRKVWYDIKIPALLKKYKVDVFISGNGTCSMAAKIPQCLVIEDHFFLKRGGLFFIKMDTKKTLQKSDRIVTFSEFEKKNIISRYDIKEEKITVVYKGSKENFGPLSENEKGAIKEKYTAGKNYFIYTGSIHPQKNLTNLLKAFSVFKKRQKSDWKLVIAASFNSQHKRFENSLTLYKYREDVVLKVCEEEEIIKLTGSAYACIFPSFWGGCVEQVLGAINSHIPVVTSINSSMQEIAGDAALYVNPHDHTDIAGKMMLLYKDESLRNSLIEKGKIVAVQYSWEKAADLFWQCILKTCPVSETWK